MKKWFLLLIAGLSLLCTSCAAEVEYTVTSVTDCAQAESRYDRFYQSGEIDLVIPGLAEGLVPQGICHLPREDWLLFTGYPSVKGSSALIAVDRQTGEITRQASLQYADGKTYSGHAGGVCATETDIYISNAHMLYRISLEDFLALPGKGVCKFAEEIPVPVNSSYCCYAEGVLWVGEFQYGGDYKTDASHYVKTADGLELDILPDAGLDIGLTLIGMHLRPVAVPYRGEIRQIGRANLVCAYSRLPYVGGERAVYHV